ncbi:MAG: Uma2 family endonuclease [Spirulinaceae cyanobacterium]
MAATLLRKKFTVREFQQLAETGIWGEERLELLNGEIIEMGKIGPRHAAFVRRLTRLLRQQLRDAQALLDVQNPIEINPYSQPQPDLSLLIPRADDYEAGHPLPQDVLLLIEVADSTLESDRAVKVPLYSQAGIAEVWLIDIKGQTLTAYRQPSAQGYRLVQLYTIGEQLNASQLPMVALNLSDVFP